MDYRERFKIYEFIGGGSGNDDFLSDIGGTEGVRQGWAIMPYGVDDAPMNEAEIPPVKEYTAGGEEYGQFLANLLTAKLQLPRPAYIDGGSFGHAFNIGSELILKITSSISEAEAAFKIMKHSPAQFLANVYSIYKIVDSANELSFFALIEENIPDKPKAQFQRYIDVINTLMPDLDFVSLILKMRKQARCNEVIEDIKQLLTANPESGISQTNRNEVYNFMLGLLKIQDELVRFGIKSDDYSNTGNLGYKNGVLKFFDVSNLSKVVEPQVPDQDIIYLPENKEKLPEGSIDRQSADKIANKITQTNHFKHVRYAGEGTHGYAYDIGDDKIMKITSDRSEAIESLKIKGRTLEHLADIYEVYEVTPREDSIVPHSYAIIVEKLKINQPYFDRMVERLDYAFENILELDFNHILDDYVYDRRVYDDKKPIIDKYLSKNPEDAKFFYGLINIADETLKYGIESMDYLNTSNLGYKKNGNLGFFDMGFGDTNATPFQSPEKIEMEEDGSSKFSTDNSIGQDDFPAYNQNDTLPSIENDVKANIAVFSEDLEYNHVVGDATEDEFMMTEEGKKSWMPGAQSVTVKKKCRLGGLGNTSAACNQGDINNLELKNIDEGRIPSYNKTFWGWVSPDNQFTEVPRLQHQDFIMRVYKDKGGWDYDGIFDQALRDGWVRVVYEYNPDRFMGKLSINGYDKNRVKFVLGNMFYDMIKYGNNIIYLQYEKPEGSDSITTGDSEGKAKLVNYINEEIDASEATSDLGVIQAMLRGVKDVGIIAFKMYPYNLEEIIDAAGFGKIPVEQTDHNIGMHIVYRNTPRGKANAERLHEIMKSHGGYVADKTPEEAHEIGKLLDYNDASIAEYINRIYTKQKVRFEEGKEEISDNITDECLLKLFKGKKDICLVKLNGNNIRKVEKEGLRVILLQHTSTPHEWLSLVYRNNDENANKLYNVYKERGNSLTPNSPEDARMIFGMLEYSSAAIEEYIRRKFDNLTEQDVAVQKDIAIRKDFIRNEDDAKVMAIDGSTVKENGFIEFVEGGHHYVDAKDPENEQKYAKFIPENEIWVDNVFQSKPTDMEAIILHEKLERYLMKHYGYSYDKAHEIANFAETIFRQKVKEGSERNTSDAIFNVFARKFSKPNMNLGEALKKKSNKSYYRAVEKNGGKTVKFEPEGYYEAIDDEGNPIIKYDTHWVSDKPETAASYSVGGAVMGLYSMFRQHGKVPNIFYIYEINEEPDVDISHWDMGDFAHLQEVRYRRPVRGKYHGKVAITDDLKEKLDAYYEIVSSDEYEQPIYDPEYEKAQRIFQDTDYDELVAGMKNAIHEGDIMSLQNLPFKQEVEQLGGKIYSVGGAVRDEFLGKESKDLDVLITGIPMDELEQLLSKHGRVDAVGKSFGVLKFKAKGATEDIDIAIPRTEKPTGAGGHQGFDVTSDHALPIEKDLERRDFTINAIAKDTEGNIVDPFGGQEDLKNKTIRIVNPEAFSDDPLRMLRAVQFASRFGFKIEPETMRMIKDNASRIREIPPERILTEFDKIVNKGDKLTGAMLLKQTGLLKQIFGKDSGLLMGQNVWENAKTMGEFVWLLSHNLVESPAEFYRNRLRGDLDTYKEIKALDMAFNSGEATNMIEARAVASNMYITSPQSLQSQIIPNVIKTAAQELLSGKYPKTVNELAINGNDLMELGLSGKEIGDMQKLLLLKIYSNNLRNDKKELITFVNDTQVLNEERKVY